MAILGLDLGNIHPGDGIDGIQAVDARVDDHVEDGPQVAVGVLDDHHAGFLEAAHHAHQTGIEELAEVLGRHERALGVGIVVAGVDHLDAANRQLFGHLDVDVDRQIDQGFDQLGLGDDGHQQVLHAHQVAGQGKDVVEMHDDGLVAGKLVQQLFDAQVALGEKRVGRHKPLKVAHGLDGGLDLDAMFFGRVLGDIAPLAAPAIGAYPLLLELDVGQDGVQPHAHSKVVGVLAAGAERLADLAVDQPLKMGNPVGLLPAQDAHDSFFRCHFRHC